MYGPSTESTKITKGQRTARKIIDAAARCISKLGIEKTSVTNIAKEAGLKRSLVAYHFPRKDRIIFFVFEMTVDSLRTYVNDHVKQARGMEALEKMFRSYVTFYRENPHFFHVHMHFFYLASINTEAKLYNTKSVRSSVARLERALEEVITAEGLTTTSDKLTRMAWAFQMWLVGIIMHGHCIEHDVDDETFNQRFIKILHRQIDLVLISIRANKEV